MSLKHLPRLGLLAILALATIPAVSRAQDGGKIATANPANIFLNMAERKDLMAKMEAERGVLAEEEKTKLAALKNLETERNNLKAGSEQYATKSEEIVNLTIGLQTWREVKKADLQRQQKLQMRTLYQKIEDAIILLAKTEDYTLVIAEQKPEFPEDLDAISVENLRNIINGRNIIYSKPGVDISARVITALDAKYTAHR
jgi:Skp family chaperone for outer membrane proteins